MQIDEIWIDRMRQMRAYEGAVSSLRVIGIAMMVVVLGWVLLALAASITATIGKGIVMTLLVGYAVGRLHGKFVECRRAFQEVQREKSKPFTSMSASVPLRSPPRAAPESEVHTVLRSENLSVKAFVEREMASTSKDEELRKAADLTAKQLQQALEIVEGKVGKERTESDGALVGAVLDVLATNYRHATR
jgi:hypothetical protein